MLNIFLSNGRPTFYLLSLENGWMMCQAKHDVTDKYRSEKCVGLWKEKKNHFYKKESDKEKNNKQQQDQIHS